MDFRDWLLVKMKEHKLSRKEIAEACKVDVSAVGRWVRGERLPERAHVARLSKLLKVSPAVIMLMTDKDDLEEEIENVRDQSTAELIAYVPELADFVQLLRRMPPEERAALILLARSLAHR